MLVLRVRVWVLSVINVIGCLKILLGRKIGI